MGRQNMNILRYENDTSAAMTENSPEIAHSGQYGGEEQEERIFVKR